MALKNTGKVGRQCDGCLRAMKVRYRALADAYLCVTCYATFLETGRLPDAALDPQTPPPRSW